MTTPEKRIEAVLQKHAFVVDPSSRDQPLRCMCQEGRCDERGYMLRMEIDEHAAHVAAAVVQALGMVPEYARSWDGKNGQRQHWPICDTRDKAQLTGSTITNDPIEVRWCTSWGPSARPGATETAEHGSGDHRTAGTGETT